MIFLVHLKFSTLESDERELLRNAKILKLREPGIKRLFRFRLESFQRIRIHFHVNKGLEGKFPVVDVSPTTIDFGRHIGGGIVGTKKSARHKEKLEVGVPQDFLVSLQGSQLQFMKISARGQLVVLGCRLTREELRATKLSYDEGCGLEVRTSPSQHLRPGDKVSRAQ